MSQVNYRQCDLCKNSISAGEEFLQLQIVKQNNSNANPRTLVLDGKVYPGAPQRDTSLLHNTAVYVDSCLNCASPKFGVKIT